MTGNLILQENIMYAPPLVTTVVLLPCADNFLQPFFPLRHLHSLRALHIRKPFSVLRLNYPYDVGETEKVHVEGFVSYLVTELSLSPIH